MKTKVPPLYMENVRNTLPSYAPASLKQQPPRRFCSVGFVLSIQCKGTMQETA
ncbi:hypothetical protein AmDm5_1105 [Acetobacter malorum]|nr:hypothetical protein AmDm5_1105 [Acetobacter malorum]